MGSSNARYVKRFKVNVFVTNVKYFLSLIFFNHLPEFFSIVQSRTMSVSPS